MKQVILLLASLFPLPLATIVVSAEDQTTNARLGRLRSDGAQVSHSDELRNLATMLNQLSLEMRKLKLIVFRVERDNQQLKIAQLERDLLQVRAEKLKLAVQENDLKQGIDELDTVLSGLSLDSEDRPKLATSKADLEGNRLAMVYTEQQTIAQQETELTRRLQKEQLRLQELFVRGEKE